MQCTYSVCSVYKLCKVYLQGVQCTGCVLYRVCEMHSVHGARSVQCADHVQNAQSVHGAQSVQNVQCVYGAHSEQSVQGVQSVKSEHCA